MTSVSTPTPLAGRVIALPETRELDLFAELLEKRGATTLRCPLISIQDAPDAAPIEAWIQRCILGEFDDLILLTGEGLRRLVGFAERAGLRDAFVASLAGLRKFTRGPKPDRVLRELGLRTDHAAPIATSEGLMTLLQAFTLDGRAVGLQLYGENPNLPLQQCLTDAGAQVYPVAPYRYADAAQTAQVLQLIQRMAQGQVDAIAFTSTPQIKRLQEVAEQSHQIEILQAGFARCRIAAIGPIVADYLQAQGMRCDLMPTESFHLKPLVNALVNSLGSKPLESGTEPACKSPTTAPPSSEEITT